MTLENDNIRQFLTIASIWTNNYNNFDICILSKTDRKKGPKMTFRASLREKFLVTARNPETFFFVPGSVAVTKFGVFQYRENAISNPNTTLISNIRLPLKIKVMPILERSYSNINYLVYFFFRKYRTQNCFKKKLKQGGNIYTEILKTLYFLKKKIFYKNFNSKQGMLCDL